MSRITPAHAPHDPALQAALDRLTPPGLQPLVLFRTLARSPRLFQKFLAGSLLDPGELSLREREIVILRTCALNDCEYEWGVHVTLFGPKAAFTPEQVAATAERSSDAAWTTGESALLAACDTLHHTTRFDPPTWQHLREHFSETQVLEVISLAGFYRTVCLHANALELPLEPFAARFPRPLPTH
jgi:alkylhydroperoxidase family enzyme